MFERAVHRTMLFLGKQWCTCNRRSQYCFQWKCTLLFFLLFYKFLSTFYVKIYRDTVVQKLLVVGVFDKIVLIIIHKE